MHSLVCTTEASSGLSNLLALGRRPRSSDRFCAAYGKYFPPARTPGLGPLRRSSRLTVEGERPSSVAIACTVAPARRRSAICRRSASDRYRPEDGATLRGIRPPVACRHLRPVRRFTPTASQAACNVPPRASTAQNSDRLSINSFFDHMHNTSHQDGVATTD